MMTQSSQEVKPSQDANSENLTQGSNSSQVFKQVLPLFKYCNGEIDSQEAFDKTLSSQDSALFHSSQETFLSSQGSNAPLTTSQSGDVFTGHPTAYNSLSLNRLSSERQVPESQLTGYYKNVCSNDQQLSNILPTPESSQEGDSEMEEDNDLDQTLVTEKQTQIIETQSVDLCKLSNLITPNISYKDDHSSSAPSMVDLISMIPQKNYNTKSNKGKQFDRCYKGNGGGIGKSEKVIDRLEAGQGDYRQFNQANCSSASRSTGKADHFIVQQQIECRQQTEFIGKGINNSQFYQQPAHTQQQLFQHQSGSSFDQITKGKNINISQSYPVHSKQMCAQSSYLSQSVGNVYNNCQADSAYGSSQSFGHSNLVNQISCFNPNQYDNNQNIVEDIVQPLNLSQKKSRLSTIKRRKMHFIC